jgi:hypothetical protein
MTPDAKQRRENAPHHRVVIVIHLSRTLRRLTYFLDSTNCLPSYPPIHPRPTPKIRQCEKVIAGYDSVDADLVEIPDSQPSKPKKKRGSMRSVVSRSIRRQLITNPIRADPWAAAHFAGEC